MTAQPLARPALHALPQTHGAPAFVIPNHPCGCEGGRVTAHETGTATWYAEGREVWVSCPDCGGYGYHELRGIPCGSRWADAYPELAGRGGWFAARLTDGGITLGWCRSEEDARAWRVWVDWEAGVGDGALLAAMGLWPGVRR